MNHEIEDAKTKDSGLRLPVQYQGIWAFAERPKTIIGLPDGYPEKCNTMMNNSKFNMSARNVTLLLSKAVIATLVHFTHLHRHVSRK